MSRHTQWSRRAFLQGVGYTSGLSALSTLLPARPHPRTAARDGFAYVGSSDEAGNSEIHVFAVHGDDWKWKQSVPSRSPAALALHPHQHTLYAANEIDEHESLPCGTVEAYKIDPHDGSLALVNRQPLSLSGIRPRHIAVLPNGSYLAVAIHGGGAYNLLPIRADGGIGPVSQILKEIGNGTHPVYQASAHPHSIVFDPSGRYLLGTDEGCDRINCFAFENGKITRTTQALSHPVSGPGHLAMHPSGRFFYTANTLDGSIDCYRYSADSHEMRHEQRVMTHRKTDQQEEQQLVISSSGRVLYVASDGGISVSEVDPQTGELSAIQQWGQMNRRLRALMLSPDDRHLLVADDTRNELLSVSVDMENGKLGEALPMTKIASLRSLAVKYI